MSRLNLKKTAHYSSYLLIMLTAACSQQPSKDPLTPNFSSSKFISSDIADNTEQSGSTKQHATVWQRLLSLYALPEINHPRIDQQVNFYLRNPDYLARVQERAAPYLYFILDEIEAKKIPGELALLPIVESAFRPDAKSPAQASGLWQFIPPTGRLYGLKQNSWYDGRRDVVASTQAATTFLKELGERFENDWLLALASYNAGFGNIDNAIARNEDQGLPTDFWSLNLNSETSAYVPKLLAIAKIFANPEKYNVNLRPVPNEPYFEMVDVKSQLDLTKAAELAGTSLDHFFKLNPAFNRQTTDPTGHHRLLIPVDKADEFKEKLAELPHHERIKWIHYTVDDNDTLASVASRHHTQAEQIAQVNHLEVAEVKPGQILLVPMSYQAGDDDSNDVAEREPRHTASAPVHRTETVVKNIAYTAHKGDSLQKLARQYDVDVSDILAWNKLGKKAELKPGQKLVIKHAETVVASNSHKKLDKDEMVIQASKKKGETVLASRDSKVHDKLLPATAHGKKAAEPVIAVKGKKASEPVVAAKHTDSKKGAVEKVAAKAATAKAPAKAAVVVAANTAKRKPNAKG